MDAKFWHEGMGIRLSYFDNRDDGVENADIKI